MNEEKDLKSVPYVVYESAPARSERTIKRLILVLVIVTTMLFASNMIWLHEWTQYDYTDTSEEILLHNDGGNANYIGNDGDITNGDNLYPANE